MDNLWSQPLERRVPGHVDKGVDEKRRKLELQLIQDMEKSVARLGEGIDRGLTPSYSTRQILRYSSFDPPARRSAPSIRESSYGARDACRFEGDQRRLGPARTRSLTPEGGERKKFPEQVGAAGCVSNHSRRYDTPGGRSEALGHGALRSSAYHGRYDQNAAGTTLPGAKAMKQPESPSTPRKGHGIGRVDHESESNRFTTSKANREELRYHTTPNREGGSPERFGKRVSISGGQFTPRGSSPSTPRSFARWNGKALSMFDKNGKARERSSSKDVPSNGGITGGSVTLPPNHTVYMPPAKATAPAKRSPDSPRKARVTNEESAAPSSYLPGRNDSMAARHARDGVNIPTPYGVAVQRDIWGTDGFATTLRT